MKEHVNSTVAIRRSLCFIFISFKRLMKIYLSIIACNFSKGNFSSISFPISVCGFNSFHSHSTTKNCGISYQAALATECKKNCKPCDTWCRKKTDLIEPGTTYPFVFTTSLSAILLPAIHLQQHLQHIVQRGVFCW